MPVHEYEYYTLSTNAEEDVEAIVEDGDTV